MTVLMIKQIQQILVQKKCDMFVLSDKDTTHRWLLGEVVGHSLIFFTRSGKPAIIKSPLEQFDDKNWNIISPKNRDEQKKVIDGLVKGVKNFAVSGSTCSLRLQQLLNDSGKNKKIKFVDVEKDLLMLRAVKTKKEIASLQKANSLTAKCFDDMMNKWNTFSHESDAVRFIKIFALNHNIGLAFDPIVASGKNASTPHHAKNTELNKGFCVIDFGFTVDGYHADMTRTIYIGNPSANELLRYNKLLEIQEAAISLVKPGVKCSDLHNFVVRMLGVSDAKLFIHSLGHGVGLDIHELPNVAPNSDVVLLDGMCITIEPGIYDAASRNKFGIRIEDSIIVDKKGHINMTKKASKELFCVK